MEMKTIEVEVNWSRKNFCCGWSCPDFGAIIATDKTLEGVKLAFESSLASQIAEMVKAGESVPVWLAEGHYQIKYTEQVSALLRNAERYTTMAALSRATGINQKLLNNYASSVKVPREAQRQRIIDGIHQIGRAMLSL